MAVITWTGNAGLANGQWHTPGNWDLLRIPAAGDEVVIPDVGLTTQVTYSASAGTTNLASLTSHEPLAITGGVLNVGSSTESRFHAPVSLSAGTLRGSAEIGASMTWTGGIIDTGTTTIVDGASLSISGSGAKSLAGKTLVNQGVITWTAGQVDFGADSVLNNQGDLFARANAGLRSSTGAANRIVNSGNIARDVATGASEINVFFENTSTGVVAADAGTLRFTLGGQWQGGGRLDIADLATVEYSGGTQTLEADAELTGAGTLRSLGNVSVVVAGDVVAHPGVWDHNGGTLTGAGTLSIPGTMIWSGGTQAGAGTTAILAGATLQITGMSSGSGGLAGRTIDNFGTTILTAGNVSRLDWRDGSVFNNQPGALFDARTDREIAQVSGATSTFNNLGTYVKSAGAGRQHFNNVTFNNDGVVQATSGSLGLRSGASAGQFGADGAGIVEFLGGTHVLQDGVEFLGTGTARIQSGTVTIEGQVTAEIATLTLADGTLTGDGTLSVQGDMIWSGGTQAGAGKTVILADATLNITGMSSGNGGLAGRTIDNFGTTILAAGNVSRFDWRDGSVFNNQPGALFDARTDREIMNVVGATSTFNNLGTYVKSAGAGRQHFNNVAFNNDGVVQATSGILGLRAGASAGEFLGDGTGVVEFSGGTHVIEDGARFTGSGLVRIQNGVVTIAGDVTSDVADLALAGGQLGGDGTLTILERMTWVGGRQAGAGTTIIGSDAVLNITGISAGSGGLFERTIDNFGTTILAAGNVSRFDWGDGAVFNNLPGALFDIRTDREFAQVVGATSTFDNRGSLVKSAGTGTTNFNGIDFANSGSVEILAGTLRGTADWTQSGGVTRLSGGNLTVDEWDLVGGMLAGRGTVTGDVNHLGGTIAPGASPGQLNITGNLVQTAASRIEIEIGGTTPGDEHDRLAIGGAATLAGVLAVQVIDDFAPAPGERFRVLSFDRFTGFFQQVTGLVLRLHDAFAVETTATSVDLAAQVASDLKVTEVLVAPGVGVPYDPLHVTYTVTNLGQPTTVDRWTDSIFLSTNDVFDPGDKLIGRLEHVGALGTQESYTATLSSHMPSAADGSYRVFVLTDSRAQVADFDPTNNLGASDPLLVQVRELTLLEPLVDEIAGGERKLFRVRIPAGGGDARIKLVNPPGVVQVLIKKGAPPDDGDFDERVFQPGKAQQTVLLRQPDPGDYFIELKCVEPGLHPFELSAAMVDFELRGVTPNRGSNAGLVSVLVTGSGFTSDTTVKLVTDAGREIPAARQVVFDANALEIALDLQEVSPAECGLGNCHLVVNDPSQTESLTAPFTVTSGPVGEIAYTLTVQSNVRAGRKGEATITVTNTGETDVDVPLVQVVATGGKVGPSGSTPDRQTFTMFGVQPIVDPDTNESYLRTVVPPGSTHTFNLSFAPDVNAPEVVINLVEIDPIAPVPYDELISNESLGAELSAETRAVLVNMLRSRLGGDDMRSLRDRLLAMRPPEVPSGASFEQRLQTLIANLFVEYQQRLNFFRQLMQFRRLPNGTLEAQLASLFPQSLGDFHQRQIFLGNIQDDPDKMAITAFELFQSDEQEPGTILYDVENSGFFIPSLTNVTGIGFNFAGVGSRLPDIVNQARTDFSPVSFEGPAPDLNDAPLLELDFGATGRHLAELDATAIEFQFAARGLFDDPVETTFGHVFEFETDGLTMPMLANATAMGFRYSTYVVDFAPTLLESLGYGYGYSTSGIVRRNGGTGNGVTIDFAGQAAMLPGNVNATGLAFGFETVGVTLEADQSATGLFRQSRNLPIAPVTQLLSNGVEASVAATETAPESEPDPDEPNPLVEEGVVTEEESDATKNKSADQIRATVGEALKTLVLAVQRVFSQKSQVLRAIDPNDIIGPAGFGDERFLTADRLLPYTIRFENLPTATAPAQEVVVTHPLDADLDLDTFVLGDIGFGDTLVDVPDGLDAYSTRLDLRATHAIFVDVSASLDRLSRAATWRFTSVEPTTGDLPFDPLAGFLPPNAEDGRGEGFVNYTIRAAADSPTGTRLDAAATIVFDVEAPLATPPVFNTIDAGRPASSVEPLPARTTSTEFTVNWQGTDDDGGSGLAFFDVYVAVDGGSFEPFVLGTTATSSLFVGEVGRRYGFISVATDNVGFREATPSVEQAFTTIDDEEPTAQLNGLVWDDFNRDGQVNFDERGIADVLIELTGVDEDGNSVMRSTSTDVDGYFAFLDLPAGQYALVETQPEGFDDGADVVGTLDGIVVGNALVNDRIDGITIPAGANGDNYNFGEHAVGTRFLGSGQTAGIGFWQNRQGRSLIRALNGGESATQLGNWLAATFPNLYGDLAGQSNAFVAEYYSTLFRQSPRDVAGSPRLEAQVMSTALSVYVTNSTLAGTIATGYGFRVSEAGTGLALVTVGPFGAPFGLDDWEVTTVMDLLRAADARSRRGRLYDGDGSGTIDARERMLRAQANFVFSLINEWGGI